MCSSRYENKCVCVWECADAVTQSWCFLGKALSIAIFKAVTPPIKIIELVSLWLVSRWSLQLRLWTCSSVQHLQFHLMYFWFVSVLLWSTVSCIFIPWTSFLLNLHSQSCQPIVSRHIIFWASQSARWGEIRTLPCEWVCVSPCYILVQQTGRSLYQRHHDRSADTSFTLYSAGEQYWFLLTRSEYSGVACG